MNTPFKAYTGNDPYLFISYAHKDAAFVYPAISALRSLGFRIWYDEGIEAGEDWSGKIADRLAGASSVLWFMSENGTANVERELVYAEEHAIPVVTVMVGSFTLSPEQEKRTTVYQYLRLGDYKTYLEFAKAVDPSLSRYGVKDSSPKEPFPFQDSRIRTGTDPARKKKRTLLFSVLAIFLLALAAGFFLLFRDVPLVTGMETALATDSVSEAGFSVTVSLNYSDEYEYGTIFMQSASGKHLKFIPVVITQSLGPEENLTDVPSVVGTEIADGAKLLIDAGLTKFTVTAESQSELAKGYISAQSIPAGLRVSRKNTIGLDVRTDGSGLTFTINGKSYTLKEGETLTLDLTDETLSDDSGNGTDAKQDEPENDTPDENEQTPDNGNEETPDNGNGETRPEVNPDQNTDNETNENSESNVETAVMIPEDSVLRNYGLSGRADAVRTVYLYGSTRKDAYVLSAVEDVYADITHAILADSHRYSFGDLTDLSDFSILENLEELCLAGNDVSSLSPLYGLANLKLLDLTGNGQVSIDGISALESLETLNLTETNVEDYSELLRLKNLKTVYVSGDYYETVLGLSGRTFEVISTDRIVYNYEELKAALSDKDATSVLILGTIVIPEDDTLTIPRYRIVTGHGNGAQEGEDSIRFENRGTLVIQGYFGLGVFNTSNTGTIRVADGGIFSGGMAGTNNTGTFLVETGGTIRLERANHLYLEAGSFENNGEIYFRGSCGIHHNGGAFVNNGSIYYNVLLAYAGLFVDPAQITDNGRYFYNTGTDDANPSYQELTLAELLTYNHDNT